MEILPSPAAVRRARPAGTHAGFSAGERCRIQGRCPGRGMGGRGEVAVSSAVASVAVGAGGAPRTRARAGAPLARRPQPRGALPDGAGRRAPGAVGRAGRAARRRAVHHQPPRRRAPEQPLLDALFAFPDAADALLFPLLESTQRAVRSGGRVGLFRLCVRLRRAGAAAGPTRSSSGRDGVPSSGPDDAETPGARVIGMLRRSEAARGRPDIRGGGAPRRRSEQLPAGSLDAFMLDLMLSEAALGSVYAYYDTCADFVELLSRLLRSCDAPGVVARVLGAAARACSSTIPSWRRRATSRTACSRASSASTWRSCRARTSATRG